MPMDNQVPDIESSNMQQSPRSAVPVKQQVDNLVNSIAQTNNSGLFAGFNRQVNFLPP